MPAGQDRLAGYRAALVAAGLGPDPDLEESADFTQDAGAQAMDLLLRRRPTLDAVFAASDLMAVGALQTLEEWGRRVPEDVAVVGYDDDPVAAGTNPPLTSVWQPIEEMGREMARLLLEPDPTPRRVMLATELRVRRSSLSAHQVA